MREEMKRIQDQLRCAIEGDAWHGPSVTEVIESLDAERAAQPPYEGGHTACELLLHIAAWLEVTTRRLNGDKAQLTKAQDWSAPAAGSDRDAWDAAVARLHEAHESLQELLDGIDDTRLNEQVVGQKYTVYFMVHGAIQHALYHAGQMMLISRMLSAGR
jgi:uncharacterized damage-inducible protein DinB